jgi:hypothetical protein
MATKLHIAEIILLAIILFDGVVTLSGLNQEGYWEDPSIALWEEGNPFAASYMALGWPYLIGFGFAYMLVVLWLYHIENPIRFFLFGPILVVHLFGGLTWIVPPWNSFIWNLFPIYTIRFAAEIALGFGLGYLIMRTKTARKFFDLAIIIPIG